MKLITSVQIGKNGVQDNLVEALQSHFKKHMNVKVVFLKSSSRDKTKVKKTAENIIEKLGKNYTYRIVGFAIFVKKWRKAMR